ncbi:hypothetical protein W02_01940 [Nitrospira sp. KM1]|uniref:DUF2780 domain-containing protein n=1 Tax=Nitrospira sp. KM1 TaxID=1936990 RepID=UPI0013A79603|nr:DUF2780 domain-containing protein [Nitrospira sp. KM1]BCA53054.1 hypothetical protein W02_01940 [Nitrospira sp. KM1]
MRVRLALFSLVLLAVSFQWGCAEMQSLGGTETLTKLLSNQLGVTANQATGGVGSMLTLAKERLSGMDFNTLSTFIPGADSFMKSAKDLGAVTGPVGDQAGLKSAFSRLGMGQDMVPKFNQTVSDFVGKTGGEKAQNILAAALK